MEFQVVKTRGKQVGYVVDGFCFIGHSHYTPSRQGVECPEEKKLLVRCNHFRSAKCPVRGYIKNGKFAYCGRMSRVDHVHQKVNVAAMKVRERIREKASNKTLRHVSAGKIARETREEVSHLPQSAEFKHDFCLSTRNTQNRVVSI
jgi:hypothetical protein